MKNIFDIWGIPADVGRCYGCNRVTGLLDKLGVPYTFHAILVNSAEGVRYDRPVIQSLADRLGSTSLSFSYPVILYDGQRLKRWEDFTFVLLNSGYDPDIIEDA